MDTPQFIKPVVADVPMRLDVADLRSATSGILTPQVTQLVPADSSKPQTCQLNPVEGHKSDNLNQQTTDGACSGLLRHINDT